MMSWSPRLTMELLVSEKIDRDYSWAMDAPAAAIIAPTSAKCRRKV